MVWTQLHYNCYILEYMTRKETASSPQRPWGVWSVNSLLLLLKKNSRAFLRNSMRTVLAQWTLTNSVKWWWPSLNRYDNVVNFLKSIWINFSIKLFLKAKVKDLIELEKYIMFAGGSNDFPGQNYFLLKYLRFLGHIFFFKFLIELWNGDLSCSQ